MTRPITTSDHSSSHLINELEQHLLRAGTDAARMRAYRRFLPEIVRSSPDEGIRIIERANRVAIGIRDWKGSREILALRAEAHLLLRKSSAALEDLRALYNEADELEEKEIARIALSISEAYMMLGELVAARNWNQEAIERCGEGATPIRADALEGLANLYLSAGAYGEAIGFLRESLAIREELNDSSGRGRALCTIGTVYGTMGELGMAYDYHQQSVQVFQDAGDIPSAARALANMAGIHESRGELNEAFETAWRAHAVCEAHGDWTALACITITIANMHLQQEEPDLALTYYVKAHDLLRHHPDDNLMLGLYRRLGRVHEGFDELDEAEHVYRHALLIADRIGERQLQLEIHRAISGVHERQGKYREALWHYQQFATLQQELAGEEQRRKITEVQMKHDMAKVERERDATREEYLRLEAETEITRRELVETTLDLTASKAQMKKMAAAIEGRDDADRETDEEIVRNIPHELQEQALQEEDLPRTSLSPLEKEWIILRLQLTKTYPQFEATLLARYPHLTPTEIKLCSLTKLLGQDTARIARVLDNTHRTVQTQRQKIRKKMGLAKDVNFVSYIQTME